MGQKVGGDAALGLESLRGGRLGVESVIRLKVVLYSSGSKREKTALILAIPRKNHETNFFKKTGLNHILILE